MEHSITFTLDEWQEQRLAALAEEYNRVMGRAVTPEGLLENMMTVGSVHLVNDRMDWMARALLTAQNAPAKA